MKYSTDKSNTNSVNTLKHTSDHTNIYKNKSNELKYTTENKKINSNCNNNALKFTSGNDKTKIIIL